MSNSPTLDNLIGKTVEAYASRDDGTIAEEGVTLIIYLTDGLCLKVYDDDFVHGYAVRVAR